MPKVEIDYSNTIIYKITCKNPDIKDVYVGHTTNFVQRKHGHKQCCINSKSLSYACKLYETIRNNGGWDNWAMEIINFCNCANHYEARKKEQEYFISLNATLNSLEPMPSNPEKKVWTPNNFRCAQCDFICYKLGDWKRHIVTIKHIDNNKLITPSQFECICKKTYNHKSGLYAHKKKCTMVLENKADEVIDADIKLLYNNNTIMEILKQNQEFKDLIMEQNKQLIEQNKQMMELANKSIANSVFIADTNTTNNT